MDDVVRRRCCGLHTFGADRRRRSLPSSFQARPSHCSIVAERGAVGRHHRFSFGSLLSEPVDQPACAFDPQTNHGGPEQDCQNCDERRQKREPQVRQRRRRIGRNRSNQVHLLRLFYFGCLYFRLSPIPQQTGYQRSTDEPLLTTTSIGSMGGRAEGCPDWGADGGAVALTAGYFPRRVYADARRAEPAVTGLGRRHLGRLAARAEPGRGV